MPFGQERRRLGPPGHFQLAEDVTDVILDGLVTEIDLTGNLAVGLAVGDWLMALEYLFTDRFAINRV